jgi:two-component system, NtrC family, sensor histidine kinase HydH
MSTSKKRPFNLRFWFAVGSFGTIAAICVVAAFWVSDFLTESLLNRESEISQEFMQSIISADGVDMFRDDGSEPLQQNPLLLEFARHILTIPGMVRVNIYSSTHRVMWSTEKQLVGKTFPINDELERAFGGERVTQLEELAGDEKAEHVALGRSGHIIEAYIPIRTQPSGPVVGVVEFYKQPLALEATIAKAQRTVWIGAIISGFVLYLALYFVIRRAARLIERQQQHMAHMEAFVAIGQMASAVAHSLRNPMSAIRSSAELWRSQPNGEECEIGREVIREVDRMDGYVRDLLAFARSDRSQLQPVSPVKIIDTILAKQQPVIARNHIDVYTENGHGAPKDVLADQMLLEQALTSIVTNAIEAMPDGGKLGVGIDPGSGRDVRIAIVDTGRGIPPELLGRVRESYFTTKARGLGLGLVLATGIIERFDGKLEITSMPDVGTTVVISLKAA